VFLSRVRDYSSFQIGTTVFVTGAFMGLGAPVAAFLSTRMDPRYVISVGLVLFSTGLFLLADITPNWGFGALFIPQAVRGVAVLLCIVPTVNMALRGLAGPDLRYGSGLFNLMRNLGGAFGIAAVDTWLRDGSAWHAARLGDELGRNPGRANTVMHTLAARLHHQAGDPGQAMQMARAAMARVVSQQAAAQSFDDVFIVMAALFLGALVLVPFCRPAPVGGAPVEAH
jgi:DHA2 family multidrug resistance protein